MSRILVLHVVWEPVMRGEALTLIVDFHQLIRDPQIHLFLCILVRARIPVFLVYDMEVEVDRPPIHPFGNLVGSIREWSEVFTLLQKDLITAAFTLLVRLMVKLAELVG